ncbi:PD-(D/E)XK nuclease family protein [Alloscardovia venturai]|uniref:PD-(D/E)XK nuclease family protein n=1 Tax=Alloscardovia venturai TaxID=1769421 RepID=A0ABW2Y4T1_9BIFI
MAKISVSHAKEAIVASFTEPIDELERRENQDNHDEQGSHGKKEAPSFLVTGAPRSGKSTLALDVIVEAARTFGSDNVILAVTNRTIADEANRQILRRLKVSAQRRMATTLSALAFRILEERQFLLKNPSPKLINGAEQMAALRAIFDRHTQHVRVGELCDTCMLLRSYFVGSSASRDASPSDTLSLFEANITPVFLQQLRDMLARMNELGASHTKQEQILTAVMRTNSDPAQQYAREFTQLQFRLSFALRKEYAQEIIKQFESGKVRGEDGEAQLMLDSSRLLHEAAMTFARGEAYKLGICAPDVVVVDDAHELTLAGAFLLTELHKAGTRIVLIGNPDESVLGFRGAFPEFIWHKVSQDSSQNEHETLGFLPENFAQLGAIRIDLKSCYKLDDMRYKDVVASRVALNIPSALETDIPLPQRAQKFPDFDKSARSGEMLSALIGEQESAGKDDSLSGHIFHSAREEETFVINSLMCERSLNQRSWNDMAIIVHDNSTARLYGSHLQDMGVPVRYSAVTKPLSEDPVALGLFAPIQLALKPWQAYESCDELLADTHRLLRQFATSPFVLDDEGHPSLTPHHVDTALNAIATIINAWQSGQTQRAERTHQERQTDFAKHPDDTGSAPHSFGTIVEGWNRVCAHFNVSTSDYPLTGSALTVLLLRADREVSEIIMRVMSAMRGEYDADKKSIEKLLTMRDACAKPQTTQSQTGQSKSQTREQSEEAAGAADSAEILTMLWNVWAASGVARSWQAKALDFSDFAERLRYNEWLDNAMRLFDYANQKNAHMSMLQFIEHVMTLEISADSLAQLAPHNEAVTVMTPASAVARTWDVVWMSGLQQGTWPNLAVRNTMFGTDDLADVMMYGAIMHDTHSRVLDVLHAEKRSFLVALTRASCKLHMSAVWDQDTSPSDFLYEYAFEIFPRVSKMEDADFTSVPVVSLNSQSLEDELGTPALASVGDVVRQARVSIVQDMIRGELTDRGRDALSALDYLRSRGVQSADPKKWNFVHRATEASQERNDAENDSIYSQVQEVRLSPSNVEQIWGCPICYRLDQKLSGPRAGTAATSFGTVIHAVAQWASEEMHFDSTEFYHETLAQLGSDAVVIDDVARQMKARYDEIKPTQDLDVQTSEYIRQRRNDAVAQDILTNIAHYYIMAHNPALASNDKFHPPYLPLSGSEIEKEFDARFTMEDIRFAYNAIDERVSLNPHEFSQLMTMLVGGMPEGYDYDTVVHVHGFIDRVEKHGSATYVVDFKTGNKAHNLSGQANDLQLVCYQLGLTFGENVCHNDAERSAIFANAPLIDMCALFDVKHENVPAMSRGEGFAKYQPALFENGHIATSSAGRSYAKVNSAVWGGIIHYDEKILSDDNGVSEAARNRISSELMYADEDRTLYVLTLIARVFYAAACLKSETIEVRDVHDPHKRAFCQYKDVCPVCADENNSVMEEWL